MNWDRHRSLAIGWSNMISPWLCFDYLLLSASPAHPANLWLSQKLIYVASRPRCQQRSLRAILAWSHGNRLRPASWWCQITDCLLAWSHRRSLCLLAQPQEARPESEHRMLPNPAAPRLYWLHKYQTCLPMFHLHRVVKYYFPIINCQQLVYRSCNPNFLLRVLHSISSACVIFLLIWLQNHYADDHLEDNGSQRFPCFYFRAFYNKFIIQYYLRIQFLIV